MVQTIFGAAGVAYFPTPEAFAQVLDTLLAHGVTNIDTARLYAGSEVAIGAQPKRTQFTIDTKLGGGFMPGRAAASTVTEDVQDSLSQLSISQLDILYIHAPDTSIPFEETLSAIDALHKKGAFRRFGLSNFTAAQVEQIHSIASSKGYVLPSVYQGNYSPVARHLEDNLFPTLKKLGIKFYAYSPLAGGFLTKTAADLDAGKGRFNEKAVGGLYSKLYDNAPMRAALLKWNEIAEKEGVSKAELAYRWVAYHSAIAGDEANGVIFGASSLAQVEGTAGALKKGKLSVEAARGIEGIWGDVRDVAPVDNWQGAKK